MLCLYTSGKIVSTSQLASAPTHFLRNIHQVVVASDHEVHHIGPANMILYDEPTFTKETVSEEGNLVRDDVSVLSLHSLLVLLPIVHPQSSFVVALGIGILA